MMTRPVQSVHCKSGAGVAARVAAVAGLLALAAGLTAASLRYEQPGTDHPASHASTSQALPSTSVESVSIPVSNLEDSIAFFRDVLTCTLESRSEVAGSSAEHLTGVFGCRILTARLCLGSERIELRQFLAPEGRPIPIESRSNDLWFQHIAIVVSDMDKAYAHLRSRRVRHASSGPQTLPVSIPAAAGIRAFYFKDPDGHVLEIIQFPPGKGDARWQDQGQSLFLGIDHTAITVADTDRSITFYRDVLGMRVVGESENFGDEQEHLNNVFGARLRITALQATAGPRIELLEYLAPGTGRPYPADTGTNDLWCWQTNLVTGDLGAIDASLRSQHAQWISPGVVDLEHGGGGVTARDPDRHAFQVLGAGATR